MVYPRRPAADAAKLLRPDQAALGVPWLGPADPYSMKTLHCQTCSHWDQAHGLEMTTLGPIAPCTRHAPAHFLLESAALTFASDPARGNLTEMEIPMAIWPYTGRNQICGEYQPCDLEESLRRNRVRSAPLP